MGTPRYPADAGKERREGRLATADAFTAAVSSYPWAYGTVSDADTARWPSTTLATFTSMQIGACAAPHNTMFFWVRVNVPAGGAEFRVVAANGTTVLFPVTALSSGMNSLTGEGDIS